MKNSFVLLLGCLAIVSPFHGEAAPLSIATREVQLNGYNLSVDSFDSSDPLQSTDGRYDPLKGGGDLAVVASETGIRNSINVGTVEIWGRLETGLPFFLEVSGQSSIGSSAWHQSAQTGIEPGFHTTNFAYVFPDVERPFAGFTPASGTYNGVFYNYILMDGVYAMPSLTMSGGEKMLVVGTLSQLDIRGNVNLSGNSHILILPSASLRLFVGGTANLRGNGIINQGVGRHFMYLGTGTNPTLNLKVTTPFAGTLYAPSAVCTITSAGNSVADLQGNIAVGALVLGTHVNFHGDVAP